MTAPVSGNLTAPRLPPAPSAAESTRIPSQPASEPLRAFPAPDSLTPDMVKTLFEYFKSIGALPSEATAPSLDAGPASPPRSADDIRAAAFLEMRNLGWTIVNTPGQKPVTVLETEHAAPLQPDWDLPLRRQYAKRVLEAATKLTAAAQTRIARPGVAKAAE